MKQIFLFLLVLFSISSCKYNDENYYYEKAYQFEEKEQYEEAIIELNKAKIFNPKFDKAYLNRAIDKSIIGEYESAIGDLNAVIELKPNSIEPYVWRAEYKRMLERYEEAMKDVEKALSLKNTEYNGTNIVGPKEYNHNKLFPKGDNYNIEMEFIVFERGATNYHLGNYSQALNDLEFSQQEISNPISTHYYMGLTLLELNELTKACEEFKIAYKLGETGVKEDIDKYCK